MRDGKRLKARAAAAVAACLSAAALAACGQDLRRFQSDMLLGPFDTVSVLLGYAQSASEFAAFESAAFERLQTLHRMYDVFNSYEGLNNLYTINSRAGVAPVEVAQEIIDMLLAAREAYFLTGGMTNAAMGSVLRIWHEYRMRGLANPDEASLPAIEALREASALMSIEDLVIDEDARTVFLREPGMSLDVGAVAKGYAVGLAMEAAAAAGMRIGLLSVGGHVTAIGGPPGRGHWNVAVRNPEADEEGAPGHIDAIAMAGGTVSVTGTDQRYYVAGGARLGHVIDPATLMPPELYRQVAVVHPESWMADVLSTALFIMPLEQGMALAAAEGAEALWVGWDGRWHYTPGYALLSSALE
jgi:thiamine biosynthesis lipoprotein